MTDQTPIPISTLPVATELTGSEIFPVVQNGVTKQATISLVPGGGGTGGTGSGLPVKTILITADELKETSGTILSWELIPALGANKVAVPVAVLWHGIFNGTEFTATAPLHVAYGAVDGTFAGLPSISVGDTHPSQDLLKQTVDADDYSVLNWEIAFGFSTPDNPVTPTYAFTTLLANTPVCVWTPADTWLGGDSDLRVTIFYAEYDVTGASTISPPSNASFLLPGNGIESYSRLHPYSISGTDFGTGNVAFGSSGLGFFDYHRKSNQNNPDIITKNGSNQLVINYPCMVVGTVGIQGIALQTPFSAECVMTHVQDSNQWGQNILVGGAIGTLTQPPVNFDGSTGPVLSNAGDFWDGNINIEPIGPTGNVLKIQQANVSIQIVQVLGQVLNSAVAAAGTGYVVGDTFQIDDGYIPAVASVATVDGGGGVLTISFANDTTALGLGYESLTYTTTNIVPQLGSGTGLTIAVTAF